MTYNTKHSHIVVIKGLNRVSRDVIGVKVRQLPTGTKRVSLNLIKAVGA